MPVLPASSELEAAWALYRANARTLGFLPRGAFEEFAEAGGVRAVVERDDVKGYVAWRVSGSDAVLVHLCVAEDARGSGTASALLRCMIEEADGCDAIRLPCRADYTEANRLWPRFGFVNIDERTGRGVDRARLLIWRREHRKPPLLELMEQPARSSTNMVVLDANVFFDLHATEGAEFEESAALLADWLVDDIELCVTVELKNEVHRADAADRRETARQALSRYRQLTGDVRQFASMVSAVASLLPPAASDSDESDRRHLAHAIMEGARYFATRDGTLLRHADDFEAIHRIRIGRPAEIVARVHGETSGQGYAPVRLQGTRVVQRRCTAEADFEPFQNFAAGERKEEWLARARRTLAEADRLAAQIVSVDSDGPSVLWALDRAVPGRLHIPTLRALSGPLTSTLLRRVIANVLEGAASERRSRLSVTSDVSAMVGQVLAELGFRRDPNGEYARYSVRHVIDVTSVEGWLRDTFEEELSTWCEHPNDAERAFWPLKVLGGGRSSYIVSIKPFWAGALFDRELAAQDLFAVPHEPALALENAYYSGANVTIPAGSRILWYVSGKMQAIRAASVCMGTDTDEATVLSRRYRRLGTYEWHQVLKTAGGDPRRKIKAYRFSHTELLSRSVSLDELRRVISRHGLKKPTLMSPACVPETVFSDLYRMGMELSE